MRRRAILAEAQEKASRTPLSQIKVIVSAPADVRDAMETIKQKYEQYFGT